LHLLGKRKHSNIRGSKHSLNFIYSKFLYEFNLCYHFIQHFISNILPSICLRPQIAKHYSLNTYHRRPFKIHLHECSSHVSGQRQTGVRQHAFLDISVNCPTVHAQAQNSPSFRSCFMQIIWAVVPRPLLYLSPPQLSPSQLDMNIETMMGKDTYRCINRVHPSVKTVNSYDCSLVT
jgi:hypothetical protein